MNTRLEVLKKSMKLSWGELAETLGVSRSMVDQVRKGTRVFGPKAVRRLEELEVQAGIREALSSSTQMPEEQNNDIHTICTHITGMEKALERIARMLEKLLEKSSPL